MQKKLFKFFLFFILGIALLVCPKNNVKADFEYRWVTYNTMIRASDKEPYSFPQVQYELSSGELTLGYHPDDGEIYLYYYGYWDYHCKYKISSGESALLDSGGNATEYIKVDMLKGKDNNSNDKGLVDISKATKEEYVKSLKNPPSGWDFKTREILIGGIDKDESFNALEADFIGPISPTKYTTYYFKLEKPSSLAENPKRIPIDFKKINDNDEKIHLAGLYYHQGDKTYFIDNNGNYKEEYWNENRSEFAKEAYEAGKDSWSSRIDSDYSKINSACSSYMKMKGFTYKDMIDSDKFPILSHNFGYGLKPFIEMPDASDDESGFSLNCYKAISIYYYNMLSFKDYFYYADSWSLSESLNQAYVKGPIKEKARKIVESNQIDPTKATTEEKRIAIAKSLASQVDDDSIEFIKFYEYSFLPFTGKKAMEQSINAIKALAVKVALDELYMDYTGCDLLEGDNVTKCETKARSCKQRFSGNGQTFNSDSLRNCFTDGIGCKYDESSGQWTCNAGEPWIVEWLNKFNEIASNSSTIGQLSTTAEEVAVDEFQKIDLNYLEPINGIIDVDVEINCEDYTVFRWFWNIIIYSAPFLVVLFGTIDYFKIVTAGDFDQIKKAKKNFKIRIIAFIILLVIPFFVRFLLKTFGTRGSSSIEVMKCIVNGDK